MRKNILTIIGLLALSLALSLNYRYANNDYGILENTLVPQVLAQTNSTTGTGTGTSSGGITNPWLRKHQRTDENCTLHYSSTMTIDVGGTYTKTNTESSDVPDKVYICVDGWTLISCSTTCK